MGAGAAGSDPYRLNLTGAIFEDGAHLAAFLLNKDYVEMQWLMPQQEAPSAFCIATGEQYSVRDFVNAACEEIWIRIR